MHAVLLASVGDMVNVAGAREGTGMNDGPVEKGHAPGWLSRPSMGGAENSEVGGNANGIRLGTMMGTVAGRGATWNASR